MGGSKGASLVRHCLPNAKRQALHRIALIQIASVVLAVVDSDMAISHDQRLSVNLRAIGFYCIAHLISNAVNAHSLACVSVRSNELH